MPGFVSKKLLLYVAFGLAMYLIFLIGSVPASLVFNKLVPANITSMIKYQGLAGTLWQGQANQLTIKQIPVGQLKWELSALPLLWGTANVKLNAQRKDAILMSTAALSSGEIQLQDTRIELPVADLMPLLYGFPVSLDGKINGFFKNVELASESLITIEGRAVISDIQLIAPQSLSLGTLVAKFQKQDNGTRVTVNDQQGPVQVDAVVTLSETGFYTVNATLTPRTSADNAIKNMLVMLGKKDSQGRYTVNTRGRLAMKF